MYEGQAMANGTCCSNVRSEKRRGGAKSCAHPKNSFVRPPTWTLNLPNHCRQPLFELQMVATFESQSELQHLEERFHEICQHHMSDSSLSPEKAKILKTKLTQLRVAIFEKARQNSQVSEDTVSNVPALEPVDSELAETVSALDKNVDEVFQRVRRMREMVAKRSQDNLGAQLEMLASCEKSLAEPLTPCESESEDNGGTPKRPRLATSESTPSEEEEGVFEADRLVELERVFKEVSDGLAVVCSEAQARAQAAEKTVDVVERLMKNPLDSVTERIITGKEGFIARRPDAGTAAATSTLTTPAATASQTELQA